ncbi:MAG: NAD(P) transhydrogenase subunit alpha, partial [Hyphomicrobium sp.]
MVTIAVTAEGPDEPRVAVSAETVKKLSALGAKVRVESGAGARSRFSDEALRAAGAEISVSAADALSGADILLKVRRPSADEIRQLKPGAVVAAILEPYDRAGIEPLAGTGASLFSMEFMPRISRAQSMDVLSSQANLAGYKAVVDAASLFGQALPMMMTAAGTVPAAKAFIMGVGVAGLQAIATARRMGAVVSATDVRPATKEQVQSLGAKFIAVEDDEFKQAQTAAGYAKPMSAEYQAKQAELIASHIKAQDIVITTALIPGRPAPKLVSAAMLASMKPGSVIVDLAAERGGNVEGTVPGQTVEVSGVKIVGPINLAGTVAVNASSLYAKNLYA